MSTKRSVKDTGSKQTANKHKSNENTTSNTNKTLLEKMKYSRKMKRRIFPIWLRLIIALILCVFALMIGLIIGYGVIGDGNPIDALKVDTWKHIIDIVKEK